MRMNLKIGDKIRIISLPGEDVEDYYLPKSTIVAYKALIARNRPVTIKAIDRDGLPYFRFRLKNSKGIWETHLMNIMGDDNNWVKVKHREKNAG